MPTFGAVTDIVVLLHGTGPVGRDLECGIPSQPQDFQVSYNDLA